MEDSKVTHRYFIAEGDMVATSVEKYFKTLKEIDDRRVEFLKENNLEGLYASRAGGNFLAVLTNSSEKRQGYLTPKKYYEGDNIYWLHYFDRRTKIGKSMQELVGEFIIEEFSEKMCREFKVSHLVVDGWMGYRSVCGYIKDTLIFKIPFTKSNLGVNRNVNIPEEFREIKKSEFIEITEE